MASNQPRRAGASGAVDGVIRAGSAVVVMPRSWQASGTGNESPLILVLAAPGMALAWTGTLGQDVVVTDLMPAPPIEASRGRRAELAAFLRSRRGRITPGDAGLPPGPRRRTPGLRREEVAQLAGVGVTWYTWLEQGRPINASVQVLDAIARTLRLDAAEREHLYRLNDMPHVPAAGTADHLDPEIQVIIDRVDPLPASVYNRRFDLLAWNRAYAALFPGLVQSPPDERNALWHIFTAPNCCNPMLNAKSEVPLMVATMRSAFAHHVGEPAWTGFVQRLTAASPAFAQMWATHDVAEPGTRTKIFFHWAVGEFRMRASSLSIDGTPEVRITVYTPTDQASADRLAAIRARPHHCTH
jgi:transcriptional regulator with XRE-family HTH domain